MSETPSWQELLDLVEQLNNSDYENASVQFGNVSVRLSKSENFVDATPVAAAPVAAPAPAPAPVVAPAASAAAAPAAPAAPVVTGDTIDAPMIGVFYRRPAPGADEFVKPGDTVTAETTIGIIEIMKLMNPVVAGKAGVLGEFLAEDAQAVEFGQPLVQITLN
ncbi:acetyl-CoA carboxylase biotin carboxyl carrier protein [Aurantimicrobium minutum]|uniref:acetyl-CoA carboxylase biotin carboxyl carrier protein n=1 Tax=Aurantimicrobium minutum TaxID=708131 RepID=UPI0024749F94|nr:acetyl-CoA carboxylase biotin carboxyl carrier protein [Aurantimicrobium minutum]MDH6423049.1 acetyl-CoA carboxylase biotin carboxyl carrier protein [Aurantimicrobium minutum]